LAKLDNHSCWLDFENDTVRCSRLGCRNTWSPADALAEAWPELTLEVTQAKLKGYSGKVYLVRTYGEYLCTITGYTRGVLHLLDFVKPDLFDAFNQAVASCFGVNHIQLQKEVV